MVEQSRLLFHYTRSATQLVAESVSVPEAKQISLVNLQ